MDERALIGAKEISEYLRWSLSRVNKEIPLLKKANVVMHVNFCPTPGIRKRRLYTFPTLLQRYIIAKYGKGTDK